MSEVGSIKLRLKVSLRAISKVLRQPGYIAVAVLGMLIASGFILWSLNLDLLQYVWFQTTLPVIDKLDFFISVYKDLYGTYNSIEGTGIVLFSVLFGVNMSLLIFVIKHHGFAKVPKKSGIGGFALAIVGGGCVACGTSLLAPVLATVGATSSAFVRELAIVFNWLGVVLISYSIYKLGQLSAYVFAKQAK